jgi:hypothetical protein
LANLNIAASFRRLRNAQKAVAGRGLKAKIIMKPFVLPVLLAAGLALSGVAANAAPQLKGHEFLTLAKVSLDQARGIALKARPGHIADQELEKEAGGSGLRYSFDIKSHGKVVEVGVDAANGKILENGAESPTKEAGEARAEAKSPH